MALVEIAGLEAVDDEFRIIDDLKRPLPDDALVDDRLARNAVVIRRKLVVLEQLARLETFGFEMLVILIPVGLE